MLTIVHWLAASGSQGKPPSNQVRVHSITTHAPASASIATSRVSTGRPIIRDIVHHAARYHVPTHTPTNGPSSNNPAHVTLCSQPSRIVHATIWAAASVQA